MASINTNVAALTALRALTQTNSALETTQDHISTGLRVGAASDNAAYWSIATTMRSDSMALSVVQDSLGLGAATVDTAYAGVDAAIEIADKIKQKLVTARGEGVDRTKIQAEITELQGQLKGIADAAVVPGAENWLSTDSGASGYNATKSIVSSFTRVNGAVSIQTIGIDTSGIKLYDAQADAAGVVVTGTSTGTFAAAPGTFTISVGGSAAGSVDVTAGSTLDSIAADINALGIDGLTVAVDSASSQLTFANRTSGAVTFDAAFATATGLTEPTLAAPSATTNKGILDQEFDYYDGTAWQTFSVTDLDISGLSNSTTDVSVLETMIQGVDSQIGKLTEAATNLGSVTSRIDLQKDFAKSLIDTLEGGISQLVDADMNEESTRLQALQVKQQLGIQALSIANASSQSILRLFQ
jgi:flagellin